MKTKYKYVEFKRDSRPRALFWYGGPKRLGKNCRQAVFILLINDAWHAGCGYALSAAEHRDIADFLDQLNKEGKPQ